MSDEKSIKENKYESQLTGKSRETISEERNDRGFWFAKRNFYEALGEIQEANKCNDKIMEKESQGNDTLEMKDIYQAYLEKQGEAVVENSSEEPDSGANKSDEED